MSESRQVPISPPENGTFHFVRKILGYGVWVAIGLSPFLGNANVRGFTAVIAMYPEDLQNWLIPLSGLMMGMIAVILDFQADRRQPGVKKLERWFYRTVAVFLLSLVTLIAAYTQWVVRPSKTQADGKSSAIAMVTGTREVPAGRQSVCGCTPGASARQCVEDVSVNPANVEACFGPQRVAFATLALALVYLVVTASFAAAVGVKRLQRKS